MLHKTFQKAYRLSGSEFTGFRLDMPLIGSEFMWFPLDMSSICAEFM